MDGTNKSKEWLSLQKAIENRTEILVRALAKEICSCRLSGVKPIKPFAAEVSFSTIANGKNAILSPDYYLQEVQAKSVYSALNGKNLEEIIKQVQKMLQERVVVTKGRRIQLNEKTLDVLANSCFTKW